ncbi:MAG: lipase secretion chaperone [Pseudomonadota bacterium]
MAAPSTLIKLGAGAMAIGLLYATFSQHESVAVQAPAAPSDPFAFVRSMEGTRPDGDVKLDAQGQLVIDAELAHLFDYYLAGLGETDLAAIRSEIERELERRFKPGPAAQAKRLLTSYLAYKRALAGIDQGALAASGMAGAARARLQAMQKLRHDFFTPAEIAGLFGFSDAYDADALARLDISADATLTAAQRAAKLALLDSKLSPALREEREAPSRVLRTEESVARLRAQGASDDDVYRLRAAAFSTEAASRLAELDRDEAAWKARIVHYLAERAAMPAGAGGALQQLRDKYFSADEQRRLGAYE